MTNSTREPGACRIRPAVAADATALGRLGADLLRAHYAFDPQRFLTPPRDAEGGYSGFLREQLLDTDACVFVAELDEQVVGYVYAALEPMSWKELREAAGFIHDVAVDPAHRDRGIGEALIERAVEWLREHGAPRVLLWAAERNEAARRFFTRLGFRPTMVEMTRDL